MKTENERMLRIIGIDFGTSSTYMNIKRYSLDSSDTDSFNYIPVSFDHGESKGSLVTVIRENDDGSLDFGRTANEETEGSIVHRNFKMNLESPDRELREHAKMLTKRLFEYLYQNYQQQVSHLGNEDDEVQTIVSYPVKWQENTARFMVEVAVEAGFENVRGMDEATAAISTVVSRNFDKMTASGIFSADKPGYLMLVDMGAGTTDLALCKYYYDIKGSQVVSADAIKLEVVTNWPLSEDDPTFGGREIDAVLTEYIKQYLTEALPDELKQMAGAIASMDNNIKLWKENNVSFYLNKNKTVQSCGFIRAYLTPGSKRFPEIDRSRFEELIAEQLEDYSYLLLGCLENACKADPDFRRSGLDMVILAGGHSSWYFAGDMISGKMKNSPDHPALAKIRENPERLIKLPNPQSTVALGLVYNRLMSSFKLNRKNTVSDDWVKVLYNLKPNPQFMTEQTVQQGQSDVYNLVCDFTSLFRFPSEPELMGHISVFKSNPACCNTFAYKQFFKDKQNDICFCCEKNSQSPCGFALSMYGIYYETKLSAGCIGWDDFLGRSITLSGWNNDKVNLGYTTLPTNRSAVQVCYQYLSALQMELRRLLGGGVQY